MKIGRRALVASATLSMGLLGLGAAGAGASPSNAPTATTGTFICPGGVTGTFVLNSGNTHAAQTWNIGHLTFDSGSTGIFVGSALDLTITFDGQPPITVNATKGSAPGPVTCSIAESGPQFSLSGNVTGRIVMNG
jgi:hypothetical protein